MIKKEIFREYDIRGIYDSELNEDTAYLIGKAYGTILQREYNKKKCIVGYDNRLSSVSLYEALVKGILETGVDVVSIGLTTTPMYYFAWDYLNVKCGVMILRNIMVLSSVIMDFIMLLGHLCIIYLMLFKVMILLKVMGY